MTPRIQRMQMYRLQEYRLGEYLRNYSMAKFHPNGQQSLTVAFRRHRLTSSFGA